MSRANHRLAEADAAGFPRPSGLHRVPRRLQSALSLLPRLKADIDIGWYNAHTEREFKSAKSEVEQKKVDIELGQLYDGNPYNNQIRFQ